MISERSSVDFFPAATAAAVAESFFIPTVFINANRQYAIVNPGKPIRKISMMEIRKNYPFFASCSVPLLTSIILINKILREKEAPPLLAALTAGAASAFLNPLECALYHQEGPTSLKKRVADLYKKRKFSALTQGAIPYTLRNTVYSLGLNAFSPWISSKLSDPIQNTVLQNSLGGAVGGFFAGIASQPFHFLSASSKMARENGSYFSTKELLKWASKQSPQTFFKGMSWRLVRTTGGTSLINLVLGLMEAKR